MAMENANNNISTRTVAVHSCITCSNKFSSAEYFSSHLDVCNPPLKKVMNIPARKCRICGKRIPGFDLRGVMSHAADCLLAQQDKPIIVKQLGGSKRCKSVEKSNVREFEGESANDVIVNNDDEAMDESDQNCPDGDNINNDNNYIDEVNEMANDAEENVSRASEDDDQKKRHKHGKRQMDILNRFYQDNQYPDADDKEFLVVETGLTKKQLRYWFINRRRSDKLKPVNAQTSPAKVEQSDQNDNSNVQPLIRTANFKAEQYNILEESFNEDNSPDETVKMYIAKKAGLTYRQVSLYFYNRNSLKKQSPQKTAQLTTEPNSIDPVSHFLNEKEAAILNNSGLSFSIIPSPSSSSTSPQTQSRPRQPVQKPESSQNTMKQKVEGLEKYWVERGLTECPDLNTRKILARWTGLTISHVTIWLKRRAQTERINSLREMRKEKAKSAQLQHTKEQGSNNYSKRIRMARINSLREIQHVKAQSFQTQTSNEHGSNSFKQCRKVNIKFPDRFLMLETYLEENSAKGYPDYETRKFLAAASRLTFKSVTHWFYHRFFRRFGLSKPRTTVQKHCVKGMPKLHPFDSSPPAPPPALNLDDEVKAVLEEEFQINNSPDMNDIFNIGQKTGLSMKQIRHWFSKRKRPSRKRKAVNCRTQTGEPTSVTKRGRSGSPKKYRRIKNEDLILEHMECIKDKRELKDRHIRQKYATLKTILDEDFEGHLNNCEPWMNKLFALLHVTSSRRQPNLQTLTTETYLLSPILKLNNPFCPLQIIAIRKWQTEYLKAVLLLQTDWERIEQINTWGLQVLEVWVPVLVYSDILKISIENGVQELYKSTLRRNEISEVLKWQIPEYIEGCANPTG